MLPRETDRATKSLTPPFGAAPGPSRRPAVNSTSLWREPLGFPLRCPRRNNRAGRKSFKGAAAGIPSGVAVGLRDRSATVAGPGLGDAVAEHGIRLAHQRTEQSTHLRSRHLGPVVGSLGAIHHHDRQVARRVPWREPHEGAAILAVQVASGSRDLGTAVSTLAREMGERTEGMPGFGTPRVEPREVAITTFARHLCASAWWP